MSFTVVGAFRMNTWFEYVQGRFYILLYIILRLCYLMVIRSTLDLISYQKLHCCNDNGNAAYNVK